MTTRQNLFGTAGIVAAAAAIGGLGGFTATTENNNEIQAGSVAITDTDSVSGTAGVLDSAPTRSPARRTVRRRAAPGSATAGRWPRTCGSTAGH